MKDYNVAALAELSMLHFDDAELKSVEEGLKDMIRLAEMLDSEVCNGGQQDNCRESRVVREDVAMDRDIDPMSCAVYKNGKYIIVPKVVGEDDPK